MAGETFSTISTALSQIYSARLADQRNMDAIELSVLNIVPNDSGKNVAWDARFSGTKATTVFADGSDVDPAEYTKTVKVPATLGFGNYRSPASISDLAAILSAVAEGSPDELRQLVDTEIKDSLIQITKDIAVDVYTGTGTSGGNPNIVGLAGGAALSTGSYATIDRGTYTEWAANVIGNGGVDRPLTDDLMRQAEVAVFNAGGGPANMILTTGNVHRKYAGLFQAMLRVNTGGQMPSQYAMGTNDLYWSNMPVTRSSRAPAKKLFMFNTNDVELVFPRIMMPVASVPMNPMVQKMGMDLKRQYMLPIMVEPLARTGNALKFNVYTFVQLRARRPNAIATITDISES